MSARERLTKEERKKEILQGAMMLFKTKGFVNTTMEDVVCSTSLSKGGVYHYYNNTIDILHDLMYQGLEYRLRVIESHKRENKAENVIDFIADSIFEKIVDDNPFMDIYVQFLIAKKNNEKLENLFNTLKEETMKEFEKDFSEFSDTFVMNKNYDLITDFINSMILGSNLLNGRKNILEHEKAIKEAIRALLK